MNNFYPRSPCGERPLGILGRRLWYGISIHALLAESDRQNPGEHYVAFHFYPRSPCGERPGCQRPCERPTRDFYPRSPCGERRPSLSGTARHTYFYPRSPCGERLVRQPTPIRDNKFLSTLSLRRATGQQSKTSTAPRFLSTLSLRRATYGRINDISRLIFLSTLSLRRATLGAGSVRGISSNFYPRSPCGERPELDTLANTSPFISIHALLAESDP